MKRILVVAFVGLVSTWPAGAQGQDVGMFVPVDTVDVGPTAFAIQDADPSVIRARHVSIDTSVLTPLTDVLDRGGTLPVLRLNLFQNVVVGAMVEAVDLTASGYSWSGAVAGDPLGSVAVAVNGNVVSGVVRTQGRVYLIRHEGVGQHSIREVDQSGLPEGAPPLVPRSLTTVDPEPRAFVDDPGRVDIAVFYTPQAREDASGTDEIHALIDAWIADTNGAYLRSGIHHRLRLVLREEVDYTEGEDSEDNPTVEQALDCLNERDDGCLDDVHDRRQEYSADLVHLIVGGTRPDTFCGFAGVRGSFGVTHLLCSSNGFAHEIGHNSGVRHDRHEEYDEACESDAETPCFNDWSLAYAYGYVNQLGLNSGAPRERRWRTLMSYSDQCVAERVYCTYLMRFSTPDQSWYGDRLGVPGSRDLPSYRDKEDAARRGPADAVRTHNEFAWHLANRMARTAPDLTVTGIRSSVAQAAPGTVMRLSAVVENLGIATGYAPENAVTWCRVSASRCSRVVGIPASVPYLESNGRAPVSTSFALPLSRGSYTYRACISATPGETLTGNNCSEDVTVDVGTVDLRVSISLSRYSVSPGEVITIRGAVRNRGTAGSGVWRLVFWFRDGEDEWSQIGYRQYQALEAGASVTAETSFNAPENPGTYRHVACLWSPHDVYRCAGENLTVVSSQ